MAVVLFDMFGVIARVQSEESKAELVAIAGIGEADFWSTYWRLRPAYDDGTYDGRAYWAAFGAEVSSLAGNPVSLDIDALIDADLRSWSRIDQDMVAYLRMLDRRGDRLALLSNITRELADEFERTHHFLELFDVVGFSCRIGHAKPSRDAFTWCLRRLGVAAEEVLFVDDSPANIDAAATLGLRAHRFTGLDELRRLLA